MAGGEKKRERLRRMEERMHGPVDQEAAVDEAEVELAPATETTLPAESQRVDTSTNLSQNDKDKINTLHPEIRDNVTKMLQNLRKDGVTVEITLAYRSYEEQDAWKKVIAEGKRQDFDAGAEWIDFPDLPHFEKTFGLTPKKLREKKEKNDTKDGFVNVK